MHFRSPVALIGALVLVLVATVAAIDGGADARLASPLPGEWPSDGRDYTAQRYSPLTRIDASNVARLGLAWYDDLDTFRGVEATPRLPTPLRASAATADPGSSVRIADAKGRTPAA